MRIKGMNKCEVCVKDLPIGCPQHRWAAIIIIYILQVGQSPQHPWWLLQVTCHPPGWGIISCRNFSVRFQTTMRYTRCLFSCRILHRNDHEIAIVCDPRSEGRDWNNFLLKGEADLTHNQNNKEEGEFAKRFFFEGQAGTGGGAFQMNSVRLPISFLAEGRNHVRSDNPAERSCMTAGNTNRKCCNKVLTLFIWGI